MLHTHSLNSNNTNIKINENSSLQKYTEDTGDFSLGKLGKILLRVHFHNLKNGMGSGPCGMVFLLKKKKMAKLRNF